MKRDLTNTFIGLSAFGIMFFIYFPMLIVVLYSFNSESVNAFPMKGFSLRWYAKLFENAALLQSLRVSLFIAVCGTTLALIIGTMGALAMKKLRFSLEKGL